MMMKKQGLNPILPLDSYIPDGEPHVFGDRIYLFGSHDVEGGTRYCAAGNYIGWSAPVSDPTDWRCDGEIYNVTQDPGYNPEYNNDLYAPDVVRGNDGRYYLYYNLTCSAPDSDWCDGVHVAVCDTPTGHYEFYGYVRNPDGSIHNTYLMGDPAVMNDEGTIRLYAGWSLSLVAAAAHSQGSGFSGERKAQAPQGGQQRSQLPQPGDPQMNIKLAPVYRMLFKRSLEQVKDLAYPLMGANAFELEDDMLTVKKGPFRIVPGQIDTPKDSSFYGHAFYEASSIRKIGGLYYFIYSSENSNELCYATSRYPDRDFVYGGTIISNGDVGYQGRNAEDRLNMTANDHGSLEKIGDQWYIFHHRQTHRSTFSRQACAEKVTILPDGSIPQVECTSMGLSAVPLEAKGAYPAPACCVLTNGHMPHCTNTILTDDIPYITHDENERYITGIADGTRIGYKYFSFTGDTRLTLTVRGDGEGTFEIVTDDGEISSVAVSSAKNWTEYSVSFTLSKTAALYLDYHGTGRMELLAISFD